MQRACLVGMALALGACGRDEAVAPAERVVRAVGGQGQGGPPGVVLTEPLEVQVVEGERPVPDVAIEWTATGGEVVDPETTTDAEGRAAARVRLGPEPGPLVVTVAAAGADPARFQLAVTQAPPGQPPYGVFARVSVPTFEGSGEVVHPDVLPAGAALPGDPWQLAITPYPGGNGTKEQPSYFEGRDPLAWLVPPGGPNPVVPRPAAGYTSDPDIVWVADAAELWMYYRHVADANLIRLVTTRDGVRWSEPELVASAPNHELISPAVVRRGPGEWLMWSVNGGTGCSGAATTVELRRSSDGRRWSDPEPVALALEGMWAWHLEVQWIEEHGEYWMLFNAKLPGSCTTPAVFFATSTDGVTWRVRTTPVLAKGTIPELRDVVYRSTFRYDAATRDLILLYSGARYEDYRYVWSASAERRRSEDVLAAPMKGAPPAFPPPPAELEDWP